MGGERLLQQRQFFIKIGVLEMAELEPLNIMPDTIIGLFFAKRANELHEICRKHKDLHIISRRRPMMFNRFEPDAAGYLLGNGDPDPTLEWEFKPPTLAEYRYALDDALKIPVEERDDVVNCAIHLMKAAIAGADLLNAKTVGELLGKRKNNN